MIGRLRVNENGAMVGLRRFLTTFVALSASIQAPITEEKVFLNSERIIRREGKKEVIWKCHPSCREVVRNFAYS